VKLKLRVALYLAITAGILTLLVGALSTVAPTIIVYRTIVSVVLFAVLGYTSGQFAERCLRKKLVEPAPQKGKHIDVVHTAGIEDELPPPDFKPLDIDQFENIIVSSKEDGGVSADVRK